MSRALILLLATLGCVISAVSACVLEDGSLYTSFHVDEETPIESLVGSLAFFDESAIRSLDVIEGNVFFTFDMTSHEFRVAQRIDIDSGLNSFQPMLVRCTPKSGPTVEIEVDFLLEDINDMAPRFIPSDVFVFTASEALEVGSQIGVIEAKDGDKKNVFVTYELVNLQQPGLLNPFELRALHGGKVGIVLNSSLDFETMNEYNFSVLAKDCHDSGDCLSNQLISTASLTVLVEDSDDLPPKFDRDLYTPSIFEDTTEGSPVIQVGAQDLDTLSTQLFYTLQGDHSRYFSIDTLTGMITLSDSSALVEGAQFTMQAKVTQSNDEAKFDVCTVLVTVVSSTGNGPRFPDDRYTVGVSESRDVLATILVITVESRNEDPNLEFSLRGSPNTPFTIKKTAWNSVAIQTAAALDYETERSYTLTLKVSDGRVEDVTTVVIDVLNDNDNNPVFTQESYFTEIEWKENMNVIRVHAQDIDHEGDDSIIYSILSPENQLFSIDSLGWVRLQGQEDDYTEPEYTIRIQASDGDRAPRTSIVDLTVKFLQDEGEVTVPIAGKKSTPSEQGKNNVVTYAVSGVAGVLLVIVIILLACFFRRRSLAKTQNRLKQKVTHTPSDMEKQLGQQVLPPDYQYESDCLSNNNSMSTATPEDLDMPQGSVLPQEDDMASVNSDFQRNLESFSYKNLCKKEQDLSQTQPEEPQRVSFKPGSDSGRSSLHGEKSPYFQRKSDSSLAHPEPRSTNNGISNNSYIAEVPEGFRSSTGDIPALLHPKASSSRANRSTSFLVSSRRSADHGETSDYGSNTPTPDMTSYAGIAAYKTDYAMPEYSHQPADQVSLDGTTDQMTIYF